MRKAFTLFAVGLGLVAGAVVATELIFGTWFRADPLDSTGLERDRALTVSVRAEPHVYRRDHWGLRGAGVDPATITVLTVGGGGTDQPHLPEEWTWQAVMERELRAMGSQAVIANAGIDGQSTLDQLRAFQDWFPHVPGLKPRFVLLAAGYNDEADPPPSPGPAATWLRHSALIRLIASASGPADASAGAYAPVDFATLKWTDQAGGLVDHTAALAAYRERLKALAQAAHAMGAVPVLVTQVRGDAKLVDGNPWGVVADAPGGNNGLDRFHALTAFNRATREVCRDEGLLCLDMASELVFETDDFHDYLHMSPRGAEKIGRWLAGKLAGLV